ncbi:MAG: hypothetical protein QOD72_3905 [Acidimicrobiaceae bacterium]|jgi:hypothetical protein|nr:hypothetical protein [Acidimicrobiaceae bacterium]
MNGFRELAMVDVEQRSDLTGEWPDEPGEEPGDDVLVGILDDEVSWS